MRSKLTPEEYLFLFEHGLSFHRTLQVPDKQWECWICPIGEWDNVIAIGTSARACYNAALEYLKKEESGYQKGNGMEKLGRHLTEEDMDEMFPVDVGLRALKGDGMSEEKGRYIRGGDGSHWDGCEETHWDCKIVRLEKENQALRAENKELKELLKESEWVCGEDGDECWECREEQRHGHAPDCRLAKALEEK